MKIAVGGFQHETNTFAPLRTGFADFEKHDAWPGLTRGPALFDTFAGLNIPLTGFTEAARAAGHEPVPLLWASAEPGSYVNRDAYERIAGMICDDLAALGPCDAVYLDLHGAMVAEHVEDAEGELLRRVREVVGPDLPVVASFDLHANLSEQVVRHTSALTVFRTYPHLDMAETGARLLSLLEHARAGREIRKAFRRVPYLTPLSAQCTRDEPNRGLYQRVAACERDGLSVDYACGFPPADAYDTGASVVACGLDREEVERAADEMLAAIVEAEPRFENRLLAPGEAVRRARASTKAPVVLADVQDNPGAGATSDTTGLLEALVRGRARGAVLALLHDPEVAAAARRAGAGATIDASLGGKLGTPGVASFSGHFRVEGLGDGCFLCTGEMYRGTRTALGPMALLAVDDPRCDVKVIVGSERFQCLDQAVFRHLGVEPAEQRIVGVKSTIHFRADFDPIAAETLLVNAPGAHPCELESLPYRRLRRGVRLGPLGPPHGEGDAPASATSNGLRETPARDRP